MGDKLFTEWKYLHNPAKSTSVHWRDSPASGWWSGLFVGLLRKCTGVGWAMPRGCERQHENYRGEVVSSGS